MEIKVVKHLEKIDILRGIAILSVFIFHSQDCLFPDYTITDYTSGNLINTLNKRDLILNFIPSSYGGTGVTLFLLISGFLIHYGYLNNSVKFNLKLFYSKRFWRIWPAYIFVLVFFCITSFGGIEFYFQTFEGFSDFIKHAFLVHNLWDKTILSINPSFWSLALEAQLYLIYPIFLWIRKHFGIDISYAIVLCVSLISIFLGLYFKKLGAMPSYSNSILINWFIRCSGALLGEKFFLKKKIFKSNSFLWMILSFLLLFVSKYHLYTYSLIMIWGTLAWITFFEWFINSKSINSSHWFFNALATIGICSYSLYLIHQPFLCPLLSYFNLFPRSYILSVSTKIVPVFIILFLIAHSLYLLIELKTIKIGKILRSRSDYN